MSRSCPDHRRPLQRRLTRWGPRWQCPEPGCTVACWDGSTSTPADAETRRLRSECHRLFDPLWKRGNKKGRRKRAYAWLAGQLGLEYEDTHFGYFDAATCRRALEVIRPLWREKVNRG